MNYPEGNEKQGSEIAEKSSEFLQSLFRVVSEYVLLVKTRGKDETYCQLDPRKYRTTYLRTPLWDLHRSQKLGIPSVEVNYVFVYLCWRILAKCIAVHIVSPTTITWASGCTIGGRNQKQKLLPREQDTRCQRRIAPPPTESCITTALVILFYFYSTRSCIPYWDKITNKKWRGRDSDYINHGIISTNTKRLLLYRRSYVSVGCSDCVEHTKTVCHVHKRYTMECIDLLWHKANRLCWPFLGSTRNACSFWYKSSGN